MAVFRFRPRLRTQLHSDLGRGASFRNKPLSSTPASVLTRDFWKAPKDARSAEEPVARATNAGTKGLELSAPPPESGAGQGLETTYSSMAKDFTHRADRRKPPQNS